VVEVRATEWWDTEKTAATADTMVGVALVMDGGALPNYIFVCYDQQFLILSEKRTCYTCASCFREIVLREDLSIHLLYALYTLDIRYMLSFHRFFFILFYSIFFLFLFFTAICYFLIRLIDILSRWLR